MHPEWPLILFTFFLCVAGGALGAQGLLNVMGKGKKMQLASLVTALAALVVGGLSADIQYYFDPTLPDVAMVDRASIVGGIFAGANAVMFWLGVVAVGLVAPLVLTWLAKKVETGKKLAAYAGVALACVAVGGLCWRVILYVVAISIFALY